MTDETLYISTHEAALALVATSMKKARLRIDSLVVNSLMGGCIFTTGGMLHVLLQSHLGPLFQSNPGLLELLQGLFYPIGLFYVVILGCELFNSNILFFSVGLIRGAVSIVDVAISLFVSWWLNLVANIFVCYVICYYSDVFGTESVVQGSRYLVEHKAAFSFIQTFIKGIAGNFFVSMAIYLQIMAKPLHVRFFLMLLPVFTFVSIGFNHSVADMFIVVMGSINGANVSVATLAWKVLLPGALGNIIGGSFFGIVIPWYSHIYLVEIDRKLLNLPEYDLRDEQPEINTDSRVVKSKSPDYGDFEEIPEKLQDTFREKDSVAKKVNPESLKSSDNNSFSIVPPRGIYDEPVERRVNSMARTMTNRSTRSRARSIRSPKNVFPVYGMGDPLARERSIASGYEDREIFNEDDEDQENGTAEYVGSRIRNYIVRGLLNKPPQDLEKNSRPSSPNTKKMRQYSFGTRHSIRTDSLDLANRKFSSENAVEVSPTGRTHHLSLNRHTLSIDENGPFEEE